MSLCTGGTSVRLQAVGLVKGNFRHLDESEKRKWAGPKWLTEVGPEITIYSYFYRSTFTVTERKGTAKKNSPSGYRGRNDPARGDRRVQRLSNFVEMSLNLHRKDD